MSIRNVRRGTITLTAGETSKAGTIVAVEPTKAFPVIGGVSTNVSANDDYDVAYCRVTLTNATTVTAYRETAGDDCTVAYSIVEID